MQRKLTQMFAEVAVLIWIALFNTSPAVATPITYNMGSEHVTDTRFTPQYTDQGTTYGPFGWSISYTRSFDGIMLAKHVELDIEFDASIGFNAAQVSAFRATAEADIESIWNNRFVITDTTNNRTFPLAVDVTTTGPTFDQTVVVHGGLGRGDMLNWFQSYIASSPSLMAHEFGHMLGLFDEYIGGAIDRYPNPTLSNTGLMGLGALNPNPDMLPRYYQQYLIYMNALNPGDTFILQAVPEPSTWLLLGSGLAGLILWRKRAP